MIPGNVSISLRHQHLHSIINQSFPIGQKTLLECATFSAQVYSVVKAELEYGARHSQQVTANLELLEKFYAPLESLPFGDLSATQYAIIREELTCQGKLIGHNDLMIASIAKAHQLVLVTHNTKEFKRVAGLIIEDWEI